MASNMPSCVLQITAENVDIGYEGQMCGVPRKPCLQGIHEWKGCSIDSLIPYLSRVPVVFLLIEFVNPQDNGISCS